jgi:hypothetical protein
MLGKLFKTKKVLKPSGELKVAIVDEQNENLYHTFGITDERRDELIKLTKENFNKHSDISKSYAEIVDNCKHVNEVIVCVIVFERILELNKSESPGHMLAKLLGGLRKK